MLLQRFWITIHGPHLKSCTPNWHYDDTLWKEDITKIKRNKNLFHWHHNNQIKKFSKLNPIHIITEGMVLVILTEFRWVKQLIWDVCFYWHYCLIFLMVLKINQYTSSNKEIALKPRKSPSSPPTELIKSTLVILWDFLYSTNKLFLYLFVIIMYLCRMGHHGKY